MGAGDMLKSITIIAAARLLRVVGLNKGQGLRRVDDVDVWICELSYGPGLCFAC